MSTAPTARRYLRRTVHASNGSTVEVYDGRHPDSVFAADAEAGGRWVTYCATHELLANHGTLADALAWAAEPAAWCDDCSSALAAEAR